MNEIKKKRLAVLESTINYFTSKNRCHGEDKCHYAPIEGVSEGCAVGRLIKDKELCATLDTIGCVSTLDVFEQLPDDLQELGQGFLTELQILHDVASYWNETGLSFAGIQKFTYIKNVFIGE